MLRVVLGIILMLGLNSVVSCSSDKGTTARKTAKVHRADVVRRVTVPGVVWPKRTATITPPYDGYVKRLLVKVGQKVSSGDGVVVMDETLFSRAQKFPLRAPIAGTVVQVLAAEGQSVRKGDDKSALLRVDDLTEIFVQADVPEIDYGQIHKDQEVVIKLSAVTEKSYKGRVLESSLAPKQKDGWRSSRDAVEYQVRIQVLDPDSEIKPGMSALVDVIAAKKEKVLVLEHEFIHKTGDKYWVELLNGEKRDITLGTQNEVLAEVKGLEEGTEVLAVDFYGAN